jgi:hypothetical protein
MDLMDTESIGSTNSSDVMPKDYSLSSLDISAKNNININNNNSGFEANNNHMPMSKSMKLNFGVERLLSKRDDKERINKNIIYKNINNNDDDEMLVNKKSAEKDESLVYNNNNNIIESANVSGNHQLGLNLLHQQLIHADNTNGLTNHQNFILKPFPIRFGRNHNGEILIRNA